MYLLNYTAGPKSFNDVHSSSLQALKSVFQRDTYTVQVKLITLKPIKEYHSTAA